MVTADNLRQMVRAWAQFHELGEVVTDKQLVHLADTISLELEFMAVKEANNDT